MSNTKQGLGTGEIIGIALVVAVLLMIFSSGGGSANLIPPGTPLPELMAEGWVNVGSPEADEEPLLEEPSPQNSEKPSPSPSPSTGRGIIPTRENLAGKVVLVDSWATWCPPCRASMPKLARVYEKYADQGVEFVGLTPEGAEDRAAIEAFIGTVEGFTWPVGYGTTPTLDMLGVSVLPTMVVFGKDGKAQWSSTSTDGLEAALDEALAR